MSGLRELDESDKIGRINNDGAFFMSYADDQIARREGEGVCRHRLTGPKREGMSASATLRRG
jgi:hypothetical protein